MNASPILARLKQTSMWAAFVLLVAFATVLFNFLGTISCAVLTGMMLASVRRPLWHAALASLVFPAVLVLVLASRKSEVGMQQWLGLGGITFGVFWGMYLLTILLKALEATPTTAAAAAAANEPQPSGATAVAETRQPAAPLSLSELQGTWICEAPAQQGEAHRKRIEIAGETFALEIINAAGRVCASAKGSVKVERPDSMASLVFAGRSERG